MLEADRGEAFEVAATLYPHKPAIITTTRAKKFMRQVSQNGRNQTFLAQATWREIDPAQTISRSRPHDLVLWGPGTFDEEREWADIFQVLEAKGCFVLHWVLDIPAVLDLYQGYLIRRVTGVSTRFVLDWDPDMFL